MQRARRAYANDHGERLIAHDDYGVGAYLTGNDDFGGHVERVIDAG